MPSVLIIASHRPGRSPSQRFRFEQYIGYLKENGFEIDFSYIINAKDDAVFYRKGEFFSKFGILYKSWRHRRRDKKKYKQYDIVFVQREAWMLGSTGFERSIKKSGARFIFDFDDSIWLMDTSEANKRWEFLKNPQKTAKNIAYSDLVFAGNKYLADYAKQFNTNVKIIPTTIDTEKFIPDPSKKNKDVLTIGWSGSITTIKHFEYAIDFLKIIKEKYGDKVRIVVVGDETYVNPELGIKGLKWSAEEEVNILNTFDIGIMPLPDNEWAKGKCGLKGLSYMAVEVPTILSPVGVNTEIIQHGVNGFLATTTGEWVNCIEQLLESPELRKKLGANARKTVVEKYSVESQKGNYLKYFNEVLRMK